MARMAPHPEPQLDVEAEAERQKTALLFRNAGISQLVHVVNAFLLAYVNVSLQASPGVAYTWCGLVVAIAAGRYLLASRFRSAAPSARDTLTWRRRYLAATTAIGIAWGAVPVLFMWNAPDGARLFNGLVLAGMVAGAMPLLAPVPVAFWTFAGLLTVPMAMVMFLQASSRLHWAFGSMCVVFLASMLVAARYLHETLDTAIRLGLEQRRLVESQQLLQAAVEQSSSSIVMTDSEARIIFVNSAFNRTTGYSHAEAIGQNPRILKSGKMPPVVYEELWGALACGRSWHGELCNKTKEGDLYWEAASISPIVDPNGRVSNYLAVLDDITERKQAEAVIARLSEWNELLLNSAGEGIYGADLEGNCTYVNPAALALLGFDKEEVLGKNAHATFHHHRMDGSPYPHENCPITLTRHDGVRRAVEDAFVRKNGEVFPVHLSVTPMHEHSQLVGVAVVFQDIARRKAMELELTRLATTDALTGVANRRRFVQELELELARAKRFGQPAAFLMVDIDHFKRVNDTHGHATGDAVLRHLAELSRRRLRGIDLFGRLGGEEFGILLPGTNGDGALQCAESFRRYVAETPLQGGAGPIPFTISIGLTLFQPGDDVPDSILARADAALYRAKEGGRNRVEVG
jgi:diguanylate cyclase (GGDEF)-like protein/PAS domain S-box-containing protein